MDVILGGYDTEFCDDPHRAGSMSAATTLLDLAPVRMINVTDLLAFGSPRHFWPQHRIDISLAEDRWSAGFAFWFA